jgi:hypothetical protein
MRAIVTVGMLLAAVSVLALVQRPYLTGQPTQSTGRADATQTNPEKEEILSKSASQMGEMDNTTGNPTLGAVDS